MNAKVIMKRVPKTKKEKATEGIVGIVGFVGFVGFVGAPSYSGTRMYVYYRQGLCVCVYR